MLKRLFTIIMVLVLGTCLIPFNVFATEQIENFEIFCLPIKSNVTNADTINTYCKQDECFFTVSDICELTRSEYDINNNSIKISQGIFTIEINVEENILCVGNESTEFIVEEYDGEYLVKPYALLKLLCANCVYDDEKNLLFILMPVITTYEALAEINIAEIYYNVFEDESTDVYLRMTCAIIMDSCFGGLGNFFTKDASEWFEAALLEITKVDIYEYSELESKISNTTDEQFKINDILTETYNIETKSIDTLNQLAEKMKLKELDTLLENYDKLKGFGDNFIFFYNIVNTTQNKINYNMDSYELFSRTLTADNLKNVPGDFSTIVESAEKVSNEINLALSAFYSASSEEIQKRLFDKAIDSSIKFIDTANQSQSASQFVLAYDIGVGVTKILMHDKFESYSADLNAIYLSGLQYDFSIPINYMYESISNGFWNVENTKQFVDMVSLYDRTSIAMFSNLKKSNKEFGGYDSNQLDSLCNKAAQWEYNLYLCDPERDICSLEDFRTYYRNDITKSINLNDCDEYIEFDILEENSENIYYQFIQEELIPKYGLSNLQALTIDYNSPPDYSDWNGIISADICDIDGKQNLLTVILKETNGIPHLIFELYGYNENVFLIDTYDLEMNEYTTDFSVGWSDGYLCLDYGYHFNYGSSRFGSQTDIIEVNKNGFSSVFTLLDTYGTLGYHHIQNLLSEKTYFQTMDGSSEGLLEGVELIKGDLATLGLSSYEISCEDYSESFVFNIIFSDEICDFNIYEEYGEPQDYTDLRSHITVKKTCCENSESSEMSNDDNGNLILSDYSGTYYPVNSDWNIVINLQVNNDNYADIDITITNSTGTKVSQNVFSGNIMGNVLSFTSDDGFGENEFNLELKDGYISLSGKCLNSYGTWGIPEINQVEMRKDGNPVVSEFPLIGTVTTEEDRLNVRQAPSTEAEIIGKLEKGSTVTIISEADGWYEIEYNDGSGFVSREFILLASDVRESEEAIRKNEINSSDTSVNNLIYKKRQAPFGEFIEITGCNKEVKKLVIPQEIEGIEVKRIGAGAFCQAQFEEVILPETLIEIGNTAFYFCDKLENIIIPDSVTTIEFSAFAACKSLKLVVLSDNLQKIEHSTFSNCISLESITIPDVIEEISGSAFYECTNLKNIILPSKITCIEDSMFFNCKNLQSLTIPNNVTEMSSDALYGCSGLKQLKVSSGITRLKPATLRTCTNLEKIYIPSSVTSIIEGEFNNTPKITIYGDSGSYAEEYANENGIPFIIYDENTWEQ